MNEPVTAKGRTRLHAKVEDAYKPTVTEPIRDIARQPVVAHGRTRKRKGNVDMFHVPKEAIPDGWNYQWCRQSVYNQPDIAHQVGLAENGWTAVPADRHAGLFMPKGHVGDIVRDGLILMERPNELTAEARDEERAAANNLVRMQREQLGVAVPQGFDDRHPGVRPRVRSNYEPGPTQGRHQLAVD